MSVVLLVHILGDEIPVLQFLLGHKQLPGAWCVGSPFWLGRQWWLLLGVCVEGLKVCWLQGEGRTPLVGSIVYRRFLLLGGLIGNVEVLVCISCCIGQTCLVLSCNFCPWRFELLVIVLLCLGGSGRVCMAGCICRGLLVVVQVDLVAV